MILISLYSLYLFISIASSIGSCMISLCFIGTDKKNNGDKLNIKDLHKNNLPLIRKYYAFWKKDNTNKYIRLFTNILKENFN